MDDIDDTVPGEHTQELPTAQSPAAEGPPTSEPTSPGPGQAVPPPHAVWGQSPGAAPAPPGQGPGYSGPWQPAWGQTIPGWAPPPTRQARRRGGFLLPLALVLAALVLIAAGVFAGHGLWSRSVASSPIREAPNPRTSPFEPGSPSGSGGSGSSGPANAAAIASKVDPGLVDINTSLSYQSAQAAGTGMVLTSSGEVLTNNHVIAGATTISATDVGNGQTYSASVVGYDVSHDLAVLQLHNASGLHTVSIGDSSSLSVGQPVVGIGNAGGAGGTPSFVGGSITALNQSITAGDTFQGSEQLTGLIESNANIQPGDSGGPLVNSNGQVIGIDTAASSGFYFESGNGSAYSIPINGAVTLARQIVSGQGSSTVHIGATAFLGIEVQPAGTSAGTGGDGFPFGGGSANPSPTTSGVSVAQVLSGEPAGGAGIATGDTITKVDGKTVNSPSALTAALGVHHPGDSIQIQWTDTSGQSHTATVQLASGPPQ